MVVAVAIVAGDGGDGGAGVVYLLWMRRMENAGAANTVRAVTAAELDGIRVSLRAESKCRSKPRNERQIESFETLECTHFWTRQFASVRSPSPPNSSQRHPS